MDERLEGNKRGDLPDTGSVQEGRNSSFFEKNGLQHFAFKPSSVITWSVLCGIGGLIIATLSVYQRLNATVDERIQNNRELNRTLDNHEFRIKSVEGQVLENSKDIEEFKYDADSRKKKK